VSDTADFGTIQSAADRVEAVVVECARCAAAAAHPNGHYPRVCPGCGRDRSRIA
jgi:hypothetical protein